MVKNLPTMRETWVRSLGLIPGLGRSPGGGIGYPLQYCWTSLVAQTVKNPPPMQETWAWSLGWEDPLVEGMATHSSILAWRIPWTEEPRGLQSMGLQGVGNNWVTEQQQYKMDLTFSGPWAFQWHPCWTNDKRPFSCREVECEVGGRRKWVNSCHLGEEGHRFNWALEE